MEDRLGLIIPRMADGHGRRAPCRGDLPQPAVPGLAGVGLEVPGPLRPPVAKVERQTEPPGQILDKRRIRPRRLPPHAMVEVGHREPQPQLRCKMVEHAKQPHAVAAPRDRNHPGCPRAGGAPALHSPADRFEPGGRPGLGMVTVAVHEAIVPWLQEKDQQTAGMGRKRRASFRMIGS